MRPVEVSVEICPKPPETLLHTETELNEVQKTPNEVPESGLLEEHDKAAKGDPSDDVYLGEPPEIEFEEISGYEAHRDELHEVPNLQELELIDESVI